MQDRTATGRQPRTAHHVCAIESLGIKPGTTIITEENLYAIEPRGRVEKINHGHKIKLICL